MSLWGRKWRAGPEFCDGGGDGDGALVLVAARGGVENMKRISVTFVPCKELAEEGVGCCGVGRYCERGRRSVRRSGGAE